MKLLLAKHHLLILNDVRLTSDTVLFFHFWVTPKYTQVFILILISGVTLGRSHVSSGMLQIHPESTIYKANASFWPLILDIHYRSSMENFSSCVYRCFHVENSLPLISIKIKNKLQLLKKLRRIYPKCGF